MCKPGDTILGLSLASGGHLTHGYKVNFSGKVYNSLNYDVNAEGEIDYDQVEAQKSDQQKLEDKVAAALGGDQQ